MTKNHSVHVIEYGAGAVSVTTDIETNEKDVNTKAKDLVARCISQCNQAGVSHLNFCALSSLAQGLHVSMIIGTIIRLTLVERAVKYCGYLPSYHDSSV